MAFKKGRIPWNKGKHLSKEHKERLSKANKNPSEEIRKKLSDAHKGKYPSKETKRRMSKHNVRYWLGKYHSEKARRKMSKAHKGKHHSEETKKKKSDAMKRWYTTHLSPSKGKRHTKKWKENMSRIMKGRIISEETRRKLSIAHKGKKGSNWKGGVTPINILIRRGIELRLWRESVFARDNWTCQKCLERGGELNSHHIKNFSEYPELRFAIDNGITFCKRHHNGFHKIYGKMNNTREQVEEYIGKTLPLSDKKEVI